jgi:hypothetical protein
MKTACCLATLAAAAAQTPQTLCLGPVYTVDVQSFSQTEVASHGWRPPTEYTQANNFQLWVDDKAGFSLVYIHEEHDNNNRGHASHGRLTDYNRKVAYTWDWDMHTHTLSNCTAAATEYPQEPYCFGTTGGKDVKFTFFDSGTIGKDYMIDSYGAQVNDPLRKVRVDLDVVIESNASGVVYPVEEMSHYFEDNEGERKVGSSRRTFYNFADAAIPAAKFAVPDGCPK